MFWPMDVFDRRLAQATLWEHTVMKVKENKLAAAAKAGEEERGRRRCAKIGLPPLFL